MLRAHRIAGTVAQAEMMEQSLPLFLEAAFSYSKLDASNTCEEACKKVLRDNSATTEQRMQRARALVRGSLPLPLGGRVGRSS